MNATEQAEELDDLRKEITSLISSYRDIKSQTEGHGARHLALVITHLEDAFFRTTAAHKAVKR